MQKSANAQITHTQESKAKLNKISRRTQVKVDQIAKVDPAMAEQGKPNCAGYADVNFAIHCIGSINLRESGNFTKP